MKRGRWDIPAGAPAPALAPAPAPVPAPAQAGAPARKPRTAKMANQHRDCKLHGASQNNRAAGRVIDRRTTPHRRGERVQLATTGSSHVGTAVPSAACRFSGRPGNRWRHLSNAAVHEYDSRSGPSSVRVSSVSCRTSPTVFDTSVPHALRRTVPTRQNGRLLLAPALRTGISANHVGYLLE